MAPLWTFAALLFISLFLGHCQASVYCGLLGICRDRTWCSEPISDFGQCGFDEVCCSLSSLG